MTGERVKWKECPYCKGEMSSVNGQDYECPNCGHEEKVK